MKKCVCSLAIMLVSFNALAQHAVLIDEGNPDQESGQIQSETKTETRSGSFFTSHKSSSEIFAGGDYASAYEMRGKRRLGVGMEAAGEFGLLGVQAELNFAMDDSAVVGFGGGPQYSSFNIGWHHVYGGRALSPFTALSYSRWYSNSSTGSSVSDTTPGFLNQKFLSDNDRETGKFAVNLLIPGAGLQYNVLNGPYAGTTIYAEAVLLVSMANLQNVLSGAFGAMYFF